MLDGLSGLSGLSGEDGGGGVPSGVLYLADGNPVYLTDGQYAYHV